MLKSVNLERFIDSIEQGKIYIDFDARTGHNHGTKFRIKSQDIPLLYKEVVRVVSCIIAVSGTILFDIVRLQCPFLFELVVMDF